jgi:hypothetical protein
MPTHYIRLSCKVLARINTLAYLEKKSFMFVTYLSSKMNVLKDMLEKKIVLLSIIQILLFPLFSIYRYQWWELNPQPRNTKGVIVPLTSCLTGLD